MEEQVLFVINTLIVQYPLCHRVRVVVDECKIVGPQRVHELRNIDGRFWFFNKWASKLWAAWSKLHYPDDLDR